MRVFILLQIIACVTGRQGFGIGDQDWGYVNVRPQAHLFWWLYYTTADVAQVTDRPLVLWLQGGPGASSTGYGNFGEIGPVDENLTPRNSSWVPYVNVMFVDNPVGTGFSYVDNDKALTTDNNQIAQDLVEFVRVFLEQYSKFQNVPFYIASESYGGKMAAEFALLLHKEMIQHKIAVNLKGVMLISPWISPIDSVLQWAPFLYFMGAVDEQGYNSINKAALQTQELIEKNNYEAATEAWRITSFVIQNVTYGVDFYNVLEKVPAHYEGWRSLMILPSVAENLLYKIMNDQVKHSLGLNVTWESQSNAVFKALSRDFMKPATNTVESLLNTTNLKVYVVSGQLDLIVDIRGTMEWVDNLNWITSHNWTRTPRTALSVSGINEGYVKQLGNFTFYWVNRAGHMVPADNPSAMLSILSDFTDKYKP